MKLHETVVSQRPSSTPCRISIVDQNPGIDDLCTGKIATGYLGQLLNKALRLANIDRAELHITYLFNYRLPDDDIKGIGLKRWLSNDYLPEPRKLPLAGYLTQKIEKSLARVASELEAFQPAVVMPMGPAALWAFTDETAITKARGTLMTATQLVPGAKLIPTFRPGHVHRQYKMLGTWVNDFKRAARVANFEQKGASQFLRSPRHLILAPTLADIEAFYHEHLVPADLITVDIETAKGQITDIGFGTSSEIAISIPFVDYRQPNRCFWPDLDTELAVWDWVRRFLVVPVPKQFQNGPYDCFWLTRYGLKVRNWRKDTRLLHHAYAPELPKDLAYMSSVYCQEGPWKLLSEHSRSEETVDEKRDA